MNVPKLRFEKFVGGWVGKKVIDFAPLQRGFDLPLSSIVEGEFPVVFSNGILKKHNQYKATAPGVVTGRSGTIGKVTYIENNYWPHNTALWVTNFLDNLPKFVYYFYVNFDLARFGTGSGVPTLNRNDVHRQVIHVPQSLAEQTKISNFLTAIDEKITQLTQKQGLLKQYKKGVMQQIFSQKLRFKDENGREFPEWEVKPLGEISKFLDGRRKPIKESDRLKMKGKYPYYGASGIIDYINDYIFDEDIILLGEDGENIVSRNLPLAFKVSGKCWINNHAHVIKPNHLTNIDFLTQYLDSISYIKYNTGTAQPKLNQEVCRTIPLNLANLPEQTKIANFLTAIDEKITHTQTQLDAVKQYKKGLLQQLFV
ncbi:restriction endonuclease subunit S [Nitrosomonas ureae]|uniref:Type I restriction enzyme, S subunit n=1 Tax=Nitrosomonas ureae TaxID=44577 RepID=A0A286A9E8_9PROT|nr:restriction endonuclease subunit S [Nitrosomonas ureae]SOD18533.1 type I restriction enzyme, S subunit [Nitrosomonas ureae]